MVSSKYIKSLILIVCIVLAAVMFSSPSVISFFSSLDQISYLAALAGGMLLSFGFTAPFSIGIFLVMGPQKIWLLALLGAFGCLISNLFLFGFMKHSFMDRYDKLQRVVVLRDFYNSFASSKFEKVKMHTACAFYGIFYALPISDKSEEKLITGM